MKNNGLTIKVNGLTKEIAEKVGFSKVNFDALTNGKENSAFTAKVGKKTYYLATNWDSYRYGFKSDEIIKSILDGSFKGSYVVTYKNGKTVTLDKDTIKSFKYDGIDSVIIKTEKAVYLYTNRLSKSTVYGYENDEFKLVEKIG